MNELNFTHTSLATRSMSSARQNVSPVCGSMSYGSSATVPAST